MTNELYIKVVEALNGYVLVLNWSNAESRTYVAADRDEVTKKIKEELGK